MQHATNTEQAWAELGGLARDVLTTAATNLGFRLSPLNIAAFLAVGAAIYLWRRPGLSFLGWLLPARIYRSGGFRLDLKILALNYGLRLLLIAQFVALSALVADQIAALFPGNDARPSRPVLVAVVGLLTADFLTYWYHRWYHDVRWLWPFHALHHSAEDLSPVTAYRHHPLFEIGSTLIGTLVIGVVQGLMLALVVGNLDVATIAGTNVAYAVFNLTTANLRHSHIWLRYPRWLEHLLISPAQHQVHHSVDPQHYNRNYGEMLAIWDWAFGTLYVTRGDEKIRFGLCPSASLAGLADPQPSLRQALAEPFRVLSLARRRTADTKAADADRATDRQPDLTPRR